MRVGWLFAALVLSGACTSPNPDFVGRNNKDLGQTVKDGPGSAEGQCTPWCKDRQCGPDGCGGLCGLCPGTEICDEGQCVQSCKPDCGGKECGPDGCGGSCGACPYQLQCSDGGRCVTTCAPDCQGKQCGPDGCGGSCGLCPDQHSCDVSTGKCVAGGCGSIDWIGCCDGQWLKYCENGKLKSQDCSSSPKCGWDYAKKYYNCGTTGDADPTGANPRKCPPTPTPSP